MQGYIYYIVFFIFAPKHRLWVLVRRGGSNVYPQSMFKAKIRKISTENFQFLPFKENPYNSDMGVFS